MGHGEGGGYMVDGARGERRREGFWVRTEQNKLSLGRKFKQVYKQSRIYEDENGILRAKWRLEKSSLS